MVVLEHMDVWTLQAVAPRPCLASECLPRQSPLYQAIELCHCLSTWHTSRYRHTHRRNLALNISVYADLGLACWGLLMLESSLIQDTNI